MAAPRLTFLYPHFFRTLRPCKPIIRHSKPSVSRNNYFHVTSRHGLASRHGTAVEDRPLIDDQQDQLKMEKVKMKDADSKSTVPKAGDIATSKTSKDPAPQEKDRQE